MAEPDNKPEVYRFGRRIHVRKAIERLGETKESDLSQISAVDISYPMPLADRRLKLLSSFEGRP